MQHLRRVGNVSGILEAPQDTLIQDINKGRDHSRIKEDKESRGKH